MAQILELESLIKRQVRINNILNFYDKKFVNNDQPIPKGITKRYDRLVKAFNACVSKKITIVNKYLNVSA